MNCGICTKELEVDGDLLSVNCGGDCVECMARAGDPDEIFNVIEVFIAEAYEIGHAHAMNAYTTSPTRVDDGWGPLAERLFAILRASGAVEPRSQDFNQ